MKWHNATIFFSSRRRHTRSVSAFLLNRSSDLMTTSTTSISISSLQTHNVNRCGRSRHLARKLSLRRKRSSPNRSEERRVGKECRSRGSMSHYKKNWYHASLTDVPYATAEYSKVA